MHKTHDHIYLIRTKMYPYGNGMKFTKTYDSYKKKKVLAL